MKLIKR